MDPYAFVATVVGSSTMSVVATFFFTRRKTATEVTAQSVKTALEVEQRAFDRYTSAQQALDTAQQALNLARAEIRSLEDYVEELHAILDEVGIAYPERDAVVA